VPTPFLRLSTEGDGKTVRKLLHMAHEDIPDDKAARLANAVGNGKQGDCDQLVFTSRKRGISVKTNSYFSLRIADSGTGRVAGCVYAGAPISWILEQKLSMDHRQLLTQRLVEIQLMAVLERFRHRGLGSLLLTDCERRYRERGYTTSMLITSPKASPLLVPWYEKHGYVFEDPDESYHVRFWRDRGATSQFHHIQDGQRVGFKALGKPATVGLEPEAVNHPGRSVPLSYHRPVAAGVLD